MKKSVIALVTLVALFVSTACSVFAAAESFAPTNIASVRVSSPLISSSIVLETAEQRAAVSSLLRNAGSTGSSPPDSAAIVTLSVTGESGSASSYTILLQGGSLYAKKGNIVRKAADADNEAFRLMLDRLSRDKLDFAPIPTATLSVGGSSFRMGVSSSDYTYRSLSGKRLIAAKPASSTGVVSVGEGASAGVSLSRAADTQRVAVSRNGRQVWMGSAAEFASYSPGEPGEYALTVTATYADTKQPLLYSGTVVWTARVNWGTNAVTFSVSGENTYPGEMVVIRAHNVPDGLTVTMESDLSFAVSFFPDGEGGQVGLLPLATVTQAGNYPFTLRCGDYSEQYVIKAGAKQFVVQNLTVSQSTAEETINSQRANDEYVQVIAPLRPVADPAAHWTEPFLWPSTGRVSTQFGTTRYTNGSTVASRHDAIDFAVPLGTPIPATNRGRVLYAGYLQLTGNTVLIEHGYGLKSWYYHMDTLSCKTGDMVERGATIGTVGTTGFSTGPHLHFGMSVKNVFVNPATIIDTDLLGELIAP